MLEQVTVGIAPVIEDLAALDASADSPGAGIATLTQVFAAGGQGVEVTDLISRVDVAGTALPSCASATLLTRVGVTDATVATPGTAYTGGGTYTIAVQCTYNSVGTAYTWIID